MKKLEIPTPSIDEFGRDFPLKIRMKSGDIIYGQPVVTEYNDGGFIIRVFNQIENLQDWESNLTRFGTKTISIDSDDIEEISVFDNYQGSTDTNKTSNLENRDISASTREKSQAKQEIDYEDQVRNIRNIFNKASMAPVFKRNERYCVGKFAEMVAYISYNDVHNDRYIIRARPTDIINSFDFEEREIIKQYSSIEQLVEDGWRLD